MVSTLKQRARHGREQRRSRFNDYARAHVAEGRIFPFLASMTLVLAFSAGVIVRLIDIKE